MSDTIQGVQWALGQQCPLRTGKDWYQPKAALTTLSICQTYSQLRNSKTAGFGIFGDVLVYSANQAYPHGTGPYYYYPGSGMLLSKTFASYGGLDALHRLCGECPANCDSEGITGCTGFFHLPWDVFETSVQAVINRLGLATKLDEVFPRTQVQWLRFWIQSPVPVEGVRLLHVLLTAVLEDQAAKPAGSNRFSHDQREELLGFLKVLDRSLMAGINLHVNMAPPGHTDFGYHTIFPHCPRCKAEARLKRWKSKYPDEEVACFICGHKYSPARTHSSERCDKPFPDSLRELLGQSEFERFAKRYLVAQGASESEAELLVRDNEELAAKRREEGRQLMEAGKRHDRFVEKTIYSGLRNLSSGAEDESKWLFSASDAEEVLRRCKHHSGKVLFISHTSESGEQDEYVHVSWPTSAESALKKLREKGCNEKFSIRLRFPQELVDRWCEENPSITE